jgi:hypothetical protein
MSTTTRRKPRDNGQPGLVALEAASAEILTASVTIKTLRVDSRQLTMGTFRQLPERALIDEDKVELLGTVWGHVNYHPNGDHDHRQFVVQFGEQLCRSPFWVRALGDQDERHHWPIPLNKMAKSYGHCVELFAMASVREGRSPFQWRKPYGSSAEAPCYVHPEHSPFASIVLDYGWSSDKGSLYQILRDALRPEPRRDYRRRQDAAGWDIEKEDRDGEWVHVSQSAEKVQADGMARLRSRYGKSIDFGLSDRHWAEQTERLADEANDYIRRWNALMDRLNTVEQLFIAT